MTSATTFDDIELTAANHFRINLHAAVFLVIDHLRRLLDDSDLTEVTRRYPFLAEYFEAMLPYLPDGLTWGEAWAWWRDGMTEWERSGDRTSSLPLLRLCGAAGVGLAGRMQLVCVGLVEEDSRFGSIFADLTSATTRRPTMEVIAAITASEVHPAHGSDASASLVAARRNVDLGLIDVPDRSQPRSDWVAHVPAEVWDAITGHGHLDLSWTRFTAPADLSDMDDVVVPATIAERMDQLASMLRDHTVDLVVVRGPAGSDRMALAGAMCRAAGEGMLRVDLARTPLGSWGRSGALASALGAIPVAEMDLGPGETVDPGPLNAYDGPAIVVMGVTGGIDRTRFGRAVSIDVPLLTVAERRRRWAQAFGDHPVTDLESIAERFTLQGAHIGRVAPSAVAHATMIGDDRVSPAHVQVAAIELNRQLLDTLATRLDPAGSWSDVVVADFTSTKLAELDIRCRSREALVGHLGPAFADNTGIGVRALFSGVSGTGKTLAARVLASELGLDVYRVDLSAVVNKYIGETEKNLHQLLTTAEELDVVLLIDEGDSLLGRRTEVRTSNDRFANLETNFLLQRLETYRGIVIVTTNASENIDPAFQRRMDVVVAFLPPSAQERLDIWRVHLPHDHVVTDDLLTEIASRCAMTGGQIRNAAHHASLLAMGEDRAVAGEHLQRAVASEYQKAGAVSPFNPSGRRQRLSRSRSFQESLT